MNEKEIILSIAYFPNIHYFTKIISFESIIIETQENYQKQSYRNRCTILSANGALNLIIPVLKDHGNKILIKDIKIDKQKKWKHQHWNAICSAYRNSPYFEYYEHDIKPMIFSEEENLFQFNLNILKCILNLLRIQKEIKLTNTYLKNYNNISDFRYKIHPKINYNEVDKEFSPAKYLQVYSYKFDFVPNLSILDLIFNVGPDTLLILENSCITLKY